MKKLLALALLAFLPAALIQAAPEKSAAKTRPPYHKEVLKIIGTSVVKLKGTAIVGAPTEIRAAAKKKYLLLYFSASWCPPCKKFTPKFVKWYNENAKDGDFEVVLLPYDRSKKALEDYIKKSELPWLSVRLDTAAVRQLKKKYEEEQQGIPDLIVFDENDNIILREHAAAVLGKVDALLKKEKAAKTGAK